MPARPYPDASRDGPADDPYRWLEDPTDPATVRWAAEQDELFEAEQAGWATDRWHELVAELTAVDRVTGPKERGGRVFALRQRAERDHAVLVVVEGDGERVLLDPAAFDPVAFDPAHPDPAHPDPAHPDPAQPDPAPVTTTLEAWQPSTTGALVAVQIARDGTEDAQLYVLDVGTGRVVDGPIDRVRGATVGWLPGDEQFYYVRCLPPGPDAALGGSRRYHRRVWLHKIGSDPDADVLVFGEGRSKAQFYSVAVTTDGRWLTVTAGEGTDPAADVYLADLTVAGSPARPDLRPVQVGAPARTRPHVVAGTGPDAPMWLRTDADAPFGRVVACTPARPTAEHWRTLVAERPDAVLTDFAVLHGPGLPRPLGLAGWLRRSRSEITVHDLADGRRVGTVDLPGTGTIGSIAVRPGGGHEAWFGYTDFGTPPRVLHHDARTGTTSVWSGGGVGGDGTTAAEPSSTVTTHEQTCVSRDGTPVRVFVIGAADRPAGPGPTILLAYGGFGVSVQAKYAPEVLAWVRSGGVFAVACVRGGRDEGEQWRLAGSRARKQNSVDDLTAAARHLLAAGWTEPGRLGLMGVSNGGLLVGAAITQHPELYAAAVPMSPLLDMVRYELSGLGPSWVPEYGTTADPAERAALLALSPYHRVRPGTAYPAVLITAADGDTRVDPLHARKMCAALQHATTGAGPVLHHLERGVGHGERAASRRVELYATALAFLGAHLGVHLGVRPGDGGRGA